MELAAVTAATEDETTAAEADVVDDDAADEDDPTKVPSASGCISISEIEQKQSFQL